MPNSVPLSNNHTMWRNPAAVCSSRTGSASINARYQGPLTSRSRSVNATWLSAGKVVMGPPQRLAYRGQLAIACPEKDTAHRGPDGGLSEATCELAGSGREQTATAAALV